MCSWRGLSEKAKNSTLLLSSVSSNPLLGKISLRHFTKVVTFLTNSFVFMQTFKLKTNLWLACPVVSWTWNLRHHSILWTPLKDETLVGSSHKYYLIKNYILWIEELWSSLLCGYVLYFFTLGYSKSEMSSKTVKYAPSHLLVYFACWNVCNFRWG